MSETILLYEKDESRLEVLLDGTSLFVRLSGSIDRDFDLSILSWTIAKTAKHIETLSFDMNSIQSITEEGSKNWLNALKIISKFQTPSYLNLPEAFIEFANCNEKALGNKYFVKSFEAPFHCKQCNQEQSVILESQQLQFTAGGIQFPPLTCAQCNQELNFAWLESDYFRFMNNHAAARTYHAS